MRRAHFVLICLFFLSASAFAHIDADSDWSEIFADPNHSVTTDKVAFKAAEDIYYVGVVETCVVGNEVKTLAPVPLKKVIPLPQGHWQELSLGEAYLSTSVFYTELFFEPKSSASEIGGGGHNNFDAKYTLTTRNLNYDHSYTFTVDALVNDGRNGVKRIPAFTKEFTIPRCQIR